MIVMPTHMRMRVLEGRVPADLRGTYYKNGPAWRGDAHPFDARGYLARVHFDGDNGATFRGTYVGVRGNAFSGPAMLPVRNPSNTNVVALDSDTVATLYDGGAPLLSSADTLAPLELEHPGLPRMPPPWSGYAVVNSHPKKTGGAHAFVTLHYTPLGTSVRTWEGSAPRRGVHVPGEIVYLHDFATTRSCDVFFHHPLRVDFARVLSDGVAGCLRQAPDRASRVCVLSDAGPEWHDLPGEQFFASHFVAAREAATHLVVDAVCHRGYMDWAGESRILRFRIPRGRHGGRATRQVLLDRWCEFPAALDARRFLACCTVTGAHPLECIAEVSRLDGEARVAFHRDGWVVSEPVVVCARPGRPTYALFVAYGDALGRLVVLSCEHWDVACVLEYPGQLGLHGCFVPESATAPRAGTTGTR